MSGQGTLDIRAHAEPAEREDPRNALLDSLATAIIDAHDAAERNEILPLLLRRLETYAPAIAKALAARPADAASVPAPSPATKSPSAVKPRAGNNAERELRLVRVLAGLKLGKPQTDAARELLDGAKMIVLADLATLRAARGASAPATPPTFNIGDIGLIDDVGGGA
jgi:hypothetical protein